MIKTLFLVPEADNEGNYFDPALFAALESRLIAAFGGVSIRPGVRGAWRHEGRIYRDVSHEVSVALDNWTQVPEWLAILAEALVTFGQEALYIEVAGIPNIFTGGP